MRICILLLIFGLVKAGSKAKSCGALQNSEWWSVGHAVESCTDGTNVGSVCSVGCDEPYVSFNPQKPHDRWKVQCKRPKNPEWLALYTRPSNNCYFCPPWHYQTKKNRIIRRWMSGETLTGIEMRLRFLPENFGKFSTPCDDEGFLFALVFKAPLPTDVTIDILGASVTYMSARRTLVTFKPHDHLNNLQHDFWRKDGHDGTRVTVFGSSLSGIKGLYSVRSYLFCQNQLLYQEIVNDLTCHESPGIDGLPEEPNCPTGSTTTQSTTTTASTTTTVSTVATTNPPPTTTVSTGPTTTKPPSNTHCPAIPVDAVFDFTNCVGATDPQNKPASAIETWFTEDIFNDLFFKSNLGLGPHACLPYSYEAFIIAARYFPSFGNHYVPNNGGFTEDEIHKRDVAGFFAHKVQETGENNHWLLTAQPGGISAEQALDCYMKGALWTWFEGGPNTGKVQPRNRGRHKRISQILE